MVTSGSDEGFGLPYEGRLGSGSGAARPFGIGFDDAAKDSTRGAAESVPLGIRVFEVLVAAVALIVTLPVTLAIGWCIRRGTPGPALFRQTRLGHSRKPFTFWKFRTYYHDARERFPDLYRYDHPPEAIGTLKFKVPDDPRATPEGRWLRKSTLDELPNFWCVLTGKMALVGPRPEIPEMLPYYRGDMLKKFDVRPGITGLAQISGRGRLSFLDTVRHDVVYVENKSFWLDIKILLLTVKKLVTRDGAF